MYLNKKCSVTVLTVFIIYMNFGRISVHILH